MFNTAPATAPSRHFEAVAMLVAAEEVQVTDEYMASIVEDVKVGTKWVTFRDAEGKKIDEVPKFAKVAVIRQVETEESRQARLRHFRLQGVENDLNSWEPATPKAVAEMSDKVAEGHMLSYYDIEKVIVAQATDQVMAGFISMATNFAEKGEDALAAREAYCDRLRDRVIQSMGGGIYRSSSIVSNRMDEAVAAAQADFVDQGKWF